MKIKKKVFFTVLIGIALISLLIIFWFNRVNILRLKQYPELKTICQIESKGFNLDLNCRGFLKEISAKGECLNLSILKEDFTLQDFEICSTNISKDSRIPEDLEVIIPTDIKLEYEYQFPLSLSLTEGSVNIMDDSSAIEILEELEKKGNSLFNVRLNETAQINEKGYYPIETDSIIEGGDVGYLTFQSATVLEKKVVDDQIQFKFKLLINGEGREIITRVKSVNYFDQGKNTGIEIVDKSNLSMVKNMDEVGLVFLYLPSNSSVTQLDIDNFCKTPNIEWGSACFLDKSLIEYRLSNGIEEYLKESIVEKPDEVTEPENLILNLILTNV